MIPWSVFHLCIPANTFAEGDGKLTRKNGFIAGFLRTRIIFGLVVTVDYEAFLVFVFLDLLTPKILILHFGVFLAGFA